MKNHQSLREDCYEPMKSIIVILFCSFFHIIYSQDGNYNNLIIGYKTYGLGANVGDSNVVFTVLGNRLESQIYQAIPISEINSEKDTIGLKHFISNDSIFFKRSTNVFLRNSSVDSIYRILQSMTANRISSSNFCVKSGTLYEMTITADSISEKQFSMFNTFDSTAFKITNIIFSNLPKNTIEFRPLEEWKLAIICQEKIKTRKKLELEIKKLQMINKKYRLLEKN